MKYKTLLEVKEIISEAQKNFGEYEVLDKHPSETMDFSKVVQMVKELPLESQKWIIQKLEDFGSVGPMIAECLEGELDIPSPYTNLSPNGNGMNVELQTAYDLFVNKLGLNL